MRTGLSLFNSALACAAGISTLPALAQDSSDWRVKDRFRLFDKASADARQDVQALLDKLASTNDLTTPEAYHGFLDTLSGVNGATSRSASLRQSNYRPAGQTGPRTSGRYDPRYLYPDQYVIEIKGSSDPALASAACRYTSPIAEASGRCGDWVSLAVSDGKSASQAGWRITTKVEVTMAGGVRTTLPISFADRLVVALGDSYISGEGNPDVSSLLTDRPDAIFSKAGWGGEAQLGVQVMRAAQWWDEPCHRSLLSWPVLSSLAHAGRHPREAVTLVHLGCSGAIARDIYKHGEGDLPGGGDES